MAGMNRNERAISYAKRLKETYNLRDEARKILEEVDSLVWTQDNRAISTDEKIAILRETKKIFENRQLNETFGDDRIKSTDNSGVIDVINQIENEIKGRNK